MHNNIFLLAFGEGIDREGDAVQGNRQGQSHIQERQAHGGEGSGLTDGQGQSKQTGTKAEAVAPAHTARKVDVVEDAALSQQEEGKGEQAEQIQGALRHTGNLRIIPEQLNAGNQRPADREQEGHGAAAVDVFPKVANTQPEKAQTAQKGERNQQTGQQDSSKHRAVEQGEQEKQVGDTTANHRSSQ